MAFTAGSIADGQVANAPAAIYTVPGATKAYLKTVTLFNTNAAEQTVVLRVVRSGGTPRVWKRFVLAQNESGEAIDAAGSLELSTGDAITAETTTAAAVDYTVTGVLET